MDPVIGFLAAAIRIGTPLAWAALGEVVAERAGVINLSVEGAMLAGALGGALGAATTGDPWLGVAIGAVAGAAISALFALVAIWGRTDQIIAGTAITLAAVGLTGLGYRQAVAGSATGLDVRTLEPVAIPGLSSIPILGPALFNQPVLTYLVLVAAPLAWWLLFRTTWGLRLRAGGESAEAARAAGVDVRWTQTVAVVVGGLLAGVAGATLVLAQVGSFAERMTAGRGFIAIAIVVLGRWHPMGVLVAALGFGAATALQFVFQALGLDVPYQFFLMLPYLLALLALTGIVGRVRSPAGLGRSLAGADGD
ncbi:MAG: ABC transporter permease [Gemmatimonadales bacterium]|nr:ABC transporter permease [Gemmatimonadales bacterium]